MVSLADLNLNIKFTREESKFIYQLLTILYVKIIKKKK